MARLTKRPEEFFSLCGVPGHRNTGNIHRSDAAERFTKQRYSKSTVAGAQACNARRESYGAAETSVSETRSSTPRGVRFSLSPPFTKSQDYESIYNKIQRLRGERYLQRITLLLQFVLRNPCHSGKGLPKDNHRQRRMQDSVRSHNRKPPHRRRLTWRLGSIGACQEVHTQGGTGVLPGRGRVHRRSRRRPCQRLPHSPIHAEITQF